VAAQLVASRVVLSSTELVSYMKFNKDYFHQNIVKDLMESSLSSVVVVRVSCSKFARGPIEAPANGMHCCSARKVISSLFN
jgi:hypothetical protein